MLNRLSSGPKKHINMLAIFVSPAKLKRQGSTSCQEKTKCGALLKEKMQLHQFAHDLFEVLGCTFRDMLNLGRFKDQHLPFFVLETLSTDVVFDTWPLLEDDESTGTKHLSPFMLESALDEALEFEWSNISRTSCSLTLR